ncbi:MAG: hypothetical protein JO100_15335 [Pseudonocardia sp.]|nr:hypothetical protein [Pseudonocardia sp.]
MGCSPFTGSLACLLATEGDLGRPREEVVRLAEQLAGADTGLPPTRLGPVAIKTARAQLDLGDRDDAETSLIQALIQAEISNPRWRRSTR